MRRVKLCTICLAYKGFNTQQVTAGQTDCMLNFPHTDLQSPQTICIPCMFSFSANNFDNKNLLGHTNLAFLTENKALEQTTSNLDWLEFKRFFWYLFLMLGCWAK